MNDFLAHRAQISPNQTALIWRDDAWTYAAMNGIVAGMASRLAQMGIRKGKHVAVLLSNRPEYVFVIHALARLGAVLVPLNLRLTEDELRWQADQSDSIAVICEQETEAQAFALFPRMPTPGSTPAPSDDPTSPSTVGNFYERRLLLSVDTPTRPTVKPLVTTPLDDPDWLARPLHLEALQAIVYTSGTTGRPKGAMLTHANHFWSATASAFRLGHDTRDGWLLAMPLYHVGGMSIILRCCLYGTTVYLLEKFDPDRANAALDSGRVTLASFVPTMLKRLIATRQGGAPRPVRAILLGGAAAPQDLLDQAQASGWPLALTYGLTEACSQVATTTPEETRRKPGSLGKPLMFTELRVANVAGDENEDGATKKIGEIILRGPTVMHGYYRNAEATEKALRDGWLYTGDLGYLDEEGDLWIVQRRTDLIVTGGENVYPSEVERVLLAHPEVTEACVVGIPDAEWGQKVGAAIVANGGLTAETMQEHCRKYLAGYKLPRAVRFVEVLPQTASGKVIRGEVLAFFRE